VKCPGCKKDIAQYQNFCPYCGFFIGDHTSLPYENIKLTFLRADLHEFTRMSEEMLSEEIMNYLNGIFGVFQRVIESFKGSIYQVIGDEVVGIFGFRKEAGFAPHMAIFAAEFPGADVGPAGVEYYIEASDGDTADRFPPSAPALPLSLVAFRLAVRKAKKDGTLSHF
jgi:hypothetical protein